MIYNFAVNCIKKSALVLIVSQTFKPYKMTSLIRGCFVSTHRVWTRAFNLICKKQTSDKKRCIESTNEIITGHLGYVWNFTPQTTIIFSVLTAKPKVGTDICVISCVENICKGN